MAKPARFKPLNLSKLLASRFVLAFATFGFCLTVTTYAAPPVLTAPTLLSPATGAPATTTPTLSWSSVKRAAKYTVQVTVGTDTSFATPTVMTSTTATSYTVSPPLTATTYHWRVRADTKGVSGPWSSEWTFTVGNTPPPTTADTTAPSIPASLTATASSTSQIALRWGASTDNVGVTGYDVYRYGPGSTNYTRLTTTTTTGYQDSGLASTTTYSYYVKARDAAGNTSAASNTASATTQAPADTTQPTVSISTPANGSPVTGTITVSGTAGDDQGLAKVEVQLDGNAYQLATGTAAWNYQFNTAGYANGSHTITAKATDTTGNTSTVSITVTVSNTTTTTTAPNTQGTWTSPEGATITVSSTGTDPATGQPWTIAATYQRLKNCAAIAGDFTRIAPTLTVNLQDIYASSTNTGASTTNGVYTSISSIIYLKGVSSTYSIQPEAQGCHEYGHAWNNFHEFIDQNGNFGLYSHYRWSNADGSIKLADDSRFGSSYAWSGNEIIAEDYRLLFGDSLAVSERPQHMNTYIVDPRNQTGLRDWFLNTWARKP
jgi:fibronectin type 3 domain-containing protein